MGNIVSKTKEAKITKTAVLIVGGALAPRTYEFSKVYDPDFTHGFRKACELVWLPDWVYFQVLLVRLRLFPIKANINCDI